VPHSKTNLQWRVRYLSYHSQTVSSSKNLNSQPEPLFIPDPVPEYVSVRPRIRVTICFSAYKEFKLLPIKDVKILDPTDESIQKSYITELGMYEATIRDDWRIREGGVLGALAEYGDFFDCIAHYHSPQKTTRVYGWDKLFEKLQNSGFRKNIVPCMVSPPLTLLGSEKGLICKLQSFGQSDGCLDRNCPFLHDREATLADRARIIELRKMRFDYKHRPSEKEYMARYNNILNLVTSGDQALREQFAESYQPEVRQILEMERAYCANRECMRPWRKGEKNPLKACKGCKYTMYCSVSVSGSLGYESYMSTSARMPEI
jgi:hypothetical protein